MGYKLEKFSSSVAEKDSFECPKCRNIILARIDDKYRCIICGQEIAPKFDTITLVSKKVKCTKCKSAFFNGQHGDVKCENCGQKANPNYNE